MVPLSIYTFLHTKRIEARSILQFQKLRICTKNRGKREVKNTQRKKNRRGEIEPAPEVFFSTSSFFLMRLFQNPPICACCVTHQKYAANTCKIVVWNGSHSILQFQKLRKFAHAALRIKNTRQIHAKL